MAANRIFLGIVCLMCIGGAGVFGGSGVGAPSSRTAGRDLLLRYSSRDLSSLRSVEMTGKRNDVLCIARAEVGVKELRGNNDGKRVAEYLAYTGIKVPAPWCASYVSFVFGKAGYAQPRTAWSPAMFPHSRIVKEPKPADVFGIWFPELKRVAHVGLVEQVKGDWCTTLEGNTSVEGSREGQGVYRRVRHKRTIYSYANWLD
ncbi:hypothetical protein HDC92_004996 [Pedobacter sp. AK017]|uniref:peptidoglycan-binding protein n=1 Tax=Pedobacter sp. AK017 TaxID=2723073 RepID=UPI0017A52BCE|nr:peptidoglycan-binding protein [Pedobacter sp. AK017]MBB5441289.1 hypothetical protein [Pedobacter sp. AK017]